MKLIGFILNLIIGPAIMIALYNYFYAEDLREAVLLTLYTNTAFNVLVLIFYVLKILISAVSFNLVGALKTLRHILLTLFVMGLYWLAYYFYFGGNFTLNI